MVFAVRPPPCRKCAPSSLVESTSLRVVATQRQFLLRPDEKTNQAFLYCLGEAAQRFGIEIVGWLAMSNHYHAVVHDPLGRLPDFACHFHQMLAKCLNVRWSRWENLWSTEPPTYTLLVESGRRPREAALHVGSTPSSITWSTRWRIGPVLRRGACSTVVRSWFGGRSSSFATRASCPRRLR